MKKWFVVILFLSTNASAGLKLIVNPTTGKLDYILDGSNSTTTFTAPQVFRSSVTFSSGAYVDGNLVVKGSATVMGSVVSTTGFIGASSTFNWVTVASMTVTSTATIYVLSVSSYVNTSGSETINGSFYLWPSTSPPSATDLILHYLNGNLYFGGDSKGLDRVLYTEWNTAKSTTVNISNWETAKSTTVDLTNWTNAKSTTVQIAAWEVSKGTSLAQADFNLMNSTHMTKMAADDLTFSTITKRLDALQTDTNTFIPNTSGVIFSTHMAKYQITGSIYSSSNNWSAQTFSSSTIGFLVISGSVTSFGVHTSSAGFIGGSSTFTYMVVGTMSATSVNVSTLTVSSITFANTTDAIPRVQMNPGLELLISTVPDGAISTMTVTFSTCPFLQIVINSTPSTGLGGDLIVYFNGQFLPKSPVYNVIRTTQSITAPGISSSSGGANGAVGIPLFGDNPSSSTTQKMAVLTMFSNLPSMNKGGSFYGVSINSQNIAPIMLNGSFIWNVKNQQVNKVSVLYGSQAQPSAQNRFHAIGSSIHVYGRKN